MSLNRVKKKWLWREIKWAEMESLIISQPENVTEWSEGKVVMERNRFCKSQPKKMTTSPRVEEIQLTSSLDINKNWDTGSGHGRTARPSRVRGDFGTAPLLPPPWALAPQSSCCCWTLGWGRCCQDSPQVGRALQRWESGPHARLSRELAAPTRPPKHLRTWNWVTRRAGQTRLPSPVFLCQVPTYRIISPSPLILPAGLYSLDCRGCKTDSERWGPELGARGGGCRAWMQVQVCLAPRPMLFPLPWVGSLSSGSLWMASGFPSCRATTGVVICPQSVPTWVPSPVLGFSDFRKDFEEPLETVLKIACGFTWIFFFWQRGLWFWLVLGGVYDSRVTTHCFRHYSVWCSPVTDEEMGFLNLISCSQLLLLILEREQPSLRSCPMRSFRYCPRAVERSGEARRQAEGPALHFFREKWRVPKEGRAGPLPKASWTMSVLYMNWGHVRRADPRMIPDNLQNDFFFS